MLDEALLISARDRLLETAVRFFSAEPAIVGIFVGGSLAAGSADAWSDIDLRVVVTADRHAYYVDQRREFPKQWPGFLFNEWMPGAQHCVSHFRPFGKIDIFYYDAAALAPSPWYRLPIRILHDPEGMVADLIERSRDLPFTGSDDDLDFSISKGLASAHEAYRRARRGELFYALSLLDELRQHIMQADDWLHDRTPESAVLAKFDIRGSRAIVAALKASYGPCEADAIKSALRLLAETYRAQIMELHDKFGLARPLTCDLEAIDILKEGFSCHP
ncbi:nucleotidyltransferase domain-containing protein [Aquamicrobium sp. NLF2-7]|uniref:nucleotidyltransferase domain-containing protein n=1 Tax=Aquamicrobium sp. NLF2-7 TaxID=2918753 RepID=UPI001EFAA2DF|nr:nucleotidyltransferase domain-containing protein [Aquamicrobium sp. NLF2-7]MCG8273921.1 nucleotidyltransferase domain-containing protein [Aquamicrobium sp. NLF2-7]